MTNVFRERILAGRNAYITGGTSGICLGIAELFARQGARVAVQGRNPEKVQTAVQTLASYGGLMAGFLVLFAMAHAGRRRWLEPGATLAAGVGA